MVRSARETIVTTRERSRVRVLVDLALFKKGDQDVADPSLSSAVETVSSPFRCARVVSYLVRRRSARPTIS